MKFPRRPVETTSAIRKASKTLADYSKSIDERYQALELLNKFRACHQYPMNTFRATLANKLKKYKDPIIAQRLKRMPTIIEKLRRFPSMPITSMQDIGGLRAVVKTISDVKKLAENYKNSNFGHTLERVNDYISNPKDDGYRGVHLVYRYKGSTSKGAEYTGLLLELQLRTRLQHIWSTAVETMGTLIGQSLKSRKGEKKWIEFFALTSSAFAHWEKTPLVPGYEHLSLEETAKMIHEAEKELGVLEKLRGLTVAADTINSQGLSSYYHLLVLNSEEKVVTITSFPRHKPKEAAAALAAAEKRAESGEKIDPVLVAAGKLDDLKRAYPNYFLDTREFISTVSNLEKSVSGS